MRNLYIVTLIVITALTATEAWGQTYTTIADGLWSDNSIWAGGTSPGFSPTDSVFIKHNVDYGNNVIFVYNYLEVDSGGKLHSDNNKEVRVHQFTTFVNRDSVEIKNLINNGTVHNYGYFFTASFTNKSGGVIHTHTESLFQSTGQVDNNGTLINDGTVWSPHIFVNNHGTITGDGGTYLVDANFIDNAGATIGCSGPGGIDICTSWGDRPGNIVASSGSIDSSCVTICGESLFSVLPVELISFEATTDGPNTVLLQWQTATETNNHYFEVQMSIDGVEWISLAKVLSRNPNSSVWQSYTYRDEAFMAYPANVFYYRLKQVDLDGSFEYLPIVGVVPQKAEVVDVNVFPNPASDNVTISWVGMDVKGEHVTVNLYDHLGRTIQSNEVSTQAINKYKINLSELPLGIYYLEIVNEHLNVQKQLVVDRN